MKKLALMLVILLSSLTIFAQELTFISTYHIKDKPSMTTNIRRNMVITIHEKEIQIQNFSDGARAPGTLYLIVDKIESKDWNLDGYCQTYYCHTQDLDGTYGTQKAIIYVTNSTPQKIVMGLFNDEISITKYKFCKN